MDDQATYLLNGLLNRGFALGRIVRFREVARGRQATTYEVMTAQQNEYVLYLYPPTFEVELLESMATTVNLLFENRFTVAPLIRSKNGSQFAAEGPQGTRLMVSQSVTGSALPVDQLAEHDISQIGLRLSWMHRLLAEQIANPAGPAKEPPVLEQLPAALNRKLAESPARMLPAFPEDQLERLRVVLSLPATLGWTHGEITAAALLHDADHQLRTISDWALLHWGHPLEDLVDAFLSLCITSKGGVDAARATILLESYDSLRSIRRTPWTPAVAHWLARRMIDASFGRRPLPKGFAKHLASPEDLATAISSHLPS